MKNSSCGGIIRNRNIVISCIVTVAAKKIVHDTAFCNVHNLFTSSYISG